MLNRLKYLLVAVLAASATPAAKAQDLPPAIIDSVMATCRADYHRLCSFVVPGDGRVARCLLDREAELSLPCLSSVKLAYALTACMPDYYRFCPGVPLGGGEAITCLSGRIPLLAPECQRVVSANANYGRPGDWRFGEERGPYSGPGANPNAYRFDARPQLPPLGDDRFGDNDTQDGGDRFADRGNWQRYGEGRAPSDPQFDRRDGLPPAEPYRVPEAEQPSYDGRGEPIK